MGARGRRFFARINRLELSSPLVEASSSNPEFPGKIIHAFAGLHPLYGCTPKLPGISLPSLHWCSSPGECAHRDCANSRGHSILFEWTSSQTELDPNQASRRIDSTRYLRPSYRSIRIVFSVTGL